MEITSSESFVQYYGRLRQRTKSVADCIPPESIEWTYAEGRFTLGDIVRHVAAIERYMWAEIVQLKPSRYTGCGRDLADGYDEVVAYMDRLHAESLAIFGALSNADLARKCVTPDGASLRTWKWLRALCEHEIHHRGQLYIYLGMLDVKTPPLYGLTSEEVASRGAGTFD